MIFSSGEFIFLFLPASLLGYQLLSRFGRPALLGWLAFVSLIFYARWNPIYLILLLGSTILNYGFSRMIARDAATETARSGWLIAAITSNLLILTYFKYLFPLLNFFDRHGLIHHTFEDVLLPLGISFFTFTQIAYLIDLRQGIAKRQGLLSYTVFVTFFPHLIAGPIIHPREIMPQLEADRLGGLRADNMALGLSWFIMGLGKKVLIADQVSSLANKLFANPTGYGFIFAWVGALCYAIQLYFDFSGYSDMALGLARMFSIEFPINFDSPFKAPSIIEFWQRWHMTLSRYLGEYLYTPISKTVNSWRMDNGKKVSRKAQATVEGFTQMIFFPTMATMFLAGIWHGAGIQFLVWGVLHGSYLAVNHAWRLLTPKGHWLYGKLPVPISVLLTFMCVLVGLVFFRASDVHDAVYVLGTMAGVHGPGPSLQTLVHTHILGGRLLMIPACMFVIWAMPNTQEILGQIPRDAVRLPSLMPRLNWHPTVAWGFALMVLFCLAILDSGETPFLYFQF